MLKSLREQISNHIDCTNTLLQDSALHVVVEQSTQAMIKALREGKKILVAGNGGSAADAQHFAGELVSRFNYDRPGLPAIALTVDSSILTAIGNDYSYEYVFARQIEALGQKGDVFIGISTSGNSKNILAALDEAKKKNLVCVGFTGQAGGAMVGHCDHLIKVPSSQTPRIQEMHLLLEHAICCEIEREMFPR